MSWHRWEFLRERMEFKLFPASEKVFKEMVGMKRRLECAIGEGQMAKKME